MLSSLFVQVFGVQSRTTATCIHYLNGMRSVYTKLLRISKNSRFNLVRRVLDFFGQQSPGDHPRAKKASNSELEREQNRLKAVTKSQNRPARSFIHYGSQSCDLFGQCLSICGADQKDRSSGNENAK